MSFINLVMTDQLISIISDGQITKNGIITESHFKKFESSPQGYVIGITGYEKITNAIRKKFFYQPMMPYHEAEELLLSELNKFKNKQVRINQSIKYNAVMAGFVSADRIPQASLFHIEDGKIKQKNYHSGAVLSLLPDDISFNPNQLILQNLKQIPKENHALALPILQRNTLYKVASASQTVNNTVFQEIIRKG